VLLQCKRYPRTVKLASVQCKVTSHGVWAVPASLRWTAGRTAGDSAKPGVQTTAYGGVVYLESLRQVGLGNFIPCHKRGDSASSAPYPTVSVRSLGLAHQFPVYHAPHAASAVVIVSDVPGRSLLPPQDHVHRQNGLSISGHVYDWGIDALCDGHG
jgi:hypothetical protein